MPPVALVDLEDAAVDSLEACPGWSTRHGLQQEDQPGAVGRYQSLVDKSVGGREDITDLPAAAVDDYSRSKCYRGARADGELFPVAAGRLYPPGDR